MALRQETLGRLSRLLPAVQVDLGAWLCAGRASVLAAAVIAASVGFSLSYIWFLCPFDVASDEAHYWDWSLQPDWSYYSKGPLVAWLIRAGCELFGPLSLAVRGDLSAAIRTPAVACHAALLAGSYVLATRVFRSSRMGLVLAAVEAAMPLVRVGSVLMTIDPPFLACWCWALVCVAKAIDPRAESASFNDREAWRCGREPSYRPGLPVHAPSSMLQDHHRRSWGWWLGASICVILGTLAKYTMALFPVAVVACLLAHQRAVFRRPGLWIFLAASVLAWIPIVAWNAEHDWASFRHVLGQAGDQQVMSLRFRWWGPASFAGAQFGMMFGAWLPAFLAAGWRFRPARTNDMGLQLLWWCSAPVWGFFFVASWVKYGQPNWPAPAYVGGMILAVAWAREQWRGRRGRFVRFALRSTAAASLIAALFVHFPGPFRPLLSRLAGQPVASSPFPIRRVDMSARLSGWQTLAKEVDRLRDQEEAATGETPIVAGANWTIPGQLRFYCRGHPPAYALGLANGCDRHSQYDYWRPNPAADANVFAGRTFIVVGEIGPGIRSGFDKVEPGIEVIHRDRGVPIAGWTIWVCRGFHGFPVPISESGY